MPILDVELVGPVPEEVRDGLAARLADAAGAALDSPPQSCWVKLRFLDPADYAENAGGPPARVCPVLVSVLLAEWPPEDAIADLLARLTRAVADACRRPVENVHVLLEPPAAGRIAFGGQRRE